MEVKITLDTRTVIRILGIITLFAVAVAFLQAVSQALILLFISIFLAIALNPSVNYLATRLTRGRRVVATAVAYLIVILTIGGFIWAIVPPLVSETGNFIDELPTITEDLRNGDNFVSDFVRRYNLDQEVEQFTADIGNQLGNTNGPILSGIEQIGVFLVSLLTVLVMTFFLLIEGPTWLQRLWDSMPEEQRSHRQMLARKMYGIITGYINGQLLIALLASFTSLLVMLVLGLPSPLALAGIVGLFGLIPLVGATIGSLLVILFALYQSVAAGIVMLVFFLVYQQIENNAIQPYIQSRTIDMSPLLVLVAVVFGLSFGGILGGFAAIPAAGIIRILVLDYFEQRKSATTDAAK